MSSTAVSSNNIASALVAELEHEAAVTRTCLERGPADNVDWKTHVKSMKFGALAGHIAEMGGSMAVTQGLLDEFGPERVRNTPISEMAIVGSGIGAAIQGMRPIVEIMYEDFLTLSMEQLVNQAAKHRTMSGGQVKVPLTIRTQGGAGWSPGAAAGW